MLPQLALDGNPSPAFSGWFLAVCAAVGVALALGLTKLAARRDSSNVRTSAPTLPVRPVKVAIRRFFTHRLGRRGTILMLYGTGYGLYGAGQFRSQPSTRFGDLGPLTVLLESHITAWVFIIGGIIGVVVSLRPRRDDDGFGYIAVFIPLLVWIGLYATSFVTGLVTHDQAGNSAAWNACSVWAVLAGALLVNAGWADQKADGVTCE